MCWCVEVGCAERSVIVEVPKPPLLQIWPGIGLLQTTAPAGGVPDLENCLEDVLAGRVWQIMHSGGASFFAGKASSSLSEESTTTTSSLPATAVPILPCLCDTSTG